MEKTKEKMKIDLDQDTGPYEKSNKAVLNLFCVPWDSRKERAR